MSMLNEPPREGFWAKWFGGMIAPLVLAIWGLVNIVTQHGFLGGRTGRVEIEGAKAIAFGVAKLGLALALHAHYFLLNTGRISPGVASILKIVGIGVTVVGFAWLVVAIFVG